MLIIRSPKSFIFWLFVAAFAARLVAVAIYPGMNYYYGITEGYVQILNNILDGHGFTAYADLAPASAAQSQWSYVPFIERPLGYPLLLLPFFSLGRSMVMLQIMQAVLGAAAAVMVYRIGQEGFGERIARIAALVQALWPLNVRFDIVLLPDAVVAPFLLGALWLLLRGVRSNKAAPFLAAGLLLGLAMTFRADVVLLPAALAVALCFIRPFRYAWKPIALLATGCAIVVLPHTVRNYYATEGKIVPLAIGSGISLWEGISQFGDTLGTVYGDVQTVQREGYRNWAYPNGVERDKKRLEEATAIIEEHPGFYASIMLRRLPVLLKPDGIVTSAFMPTPAEYFRANPASTWTSYFLQYPVSFIAQAAIVAVQLLLLVLALIGLRRNDPTWLLSAAVILYYVLIHLVTNAEARYLYPALPFIALLGAVGFDRIWPERKETRP